MNANCFYLARRVAPVKGYAMRTQAISTRCAQPRGAAHLIKIACIVPRFARQ